MALAKILTAVIMTASIALPAISPALAQSPSGNRILVAQAEDQRWADCSQFLDRRERERCEKDRWGRPDKKKKDDDIGAAIGAGIIGLTIGAIIAGSAEKERSRRDRYDAEYERWLDYCTRKYRSFDPETGTYRASNGRRYVCR
ncbi:MULTISPECIES: BA14K family protein [unclassified Devosia]|uniref:BA14K family protein n=1 Tax=unclassified Devosia TaxID=196773 RepID=UPI00086B5E32|nr:MULTISPECIES: BA14K family protein [unclassified Devosia]MBN9363680.1 BA14K family protein [Devosia sp.]ODS84592.1 MAG: hypothetical protein ABS47_18830 [Devosia sp. SCN 66-27]OJX26980.1 MAG: hypothetical protein BGO83_24480 [Devosia sp. 66-14]